MQQSVGTLNSRPRAVRTLTIVLLFPAHMLTDHLANGDGLLAYGFIVALAGRGHRLHVITQRSDFRAPLPANVTIYGPRAGSRSGFATPLTFVLRSRRIVRKLMRTESIDVVHQLNPVCLGMSLGMTGMKLPVVLGTFVSSWPAEPRAKPSVALFAQNLLGFAKKVALRMEERGAAAFLVATPAALSRFSSLTRVHERVHSLPNGIDVSTFVPMPATESSRSTILFLASLVRKKGIYTMLDAFDAVRSAIPSAKLIVGGDGPEFGEVKRRIAERWPGGEVQMIGRVERSSVAHVMAKCAVYCLPSFGEPYGMTVVEAMACGKPVVVTDSGGVRDIVDDAGGRRVEPGNIVQLAGALIEILRSSDLQLQMAAHNRAVTERKFDWPTVMAKLEGIYEWAMTRGTA